MRARRSISVTICAELTQSLNPQQAAPPEAARLWSFALVMLLLWAVRHRVPRRLVRPDLSQLRLGWCLWIVLVLVRAFWVCRVGH